MATYDFLSCTTHETNVILITPIAGVDSERILEAYKSNFKYLVSKGFKPKVNVMDNQAAKTIKAHLTPQQVTLQLVEPHNHRVNAAERAIQTFKNRFIGALGTTDSNFPIQLWVRLAPQVQDCINLLWHLRITPDKSAYETLEDLTFSIGTHWRHCHWGPEPSFIKIWTRGPHGPHMG
jgi:hypothetical protein